MEGRKITDYPTFIDASANFFRNVRIRRAFVPTPLSPARETERMSTRLPLPAAGAAKDDVVLEPCRETGWNRILLQLGAGVPAASIRECIM